MHNLIKRALFVFFVIISNFTFSQDADQILKERGEVYFSFNLEKGDQYLEQLELISKIISKFYI